VNAHYLTIRNVPARLSMALEREKRRRGISLNKTVIDLLQAGLGLNGTRSNGLGRLAGSWSEKEHRDFLKNTARFNEVDPEMWQ
jgi:hypothetical protein